MEELIQYQINVLKNIDLKFKRYLFNEVPWEHRFIAIQGLRGVGKTTMILQYLKEQDQSPQTHLYATLEHPYFYDRSIFELAKEFVQYGGKVLVLDEVHKYPNWSKEIKLIYDGFPDLQLIFSSSSLIELFKGEADLSRRVLRYELPGMSLRECINFKTASHFSKITLDDLFSDHLGISQHLSRELRPLPLFKEYLQSGYFPFNAENNHVFSTLVQQIIDTVISVDIGQTYGYNVESTARLKKLLAIIASSVPFSINISSVAAKMGIGRNTLKTFLHELEKARIINFLNQRGKGLTKLQKPDKIYLENTNLAYAFTQNPDVGNLRETFIVNQLKNAGIEISLPKTGDVFINQNGVTVEVGGKNKNKGQLTDIPNGYVAKDDIEIGFRDSIPLWLFGFLY